MKMHYRACPTKEVKKALRNIDKINTMIVIPWSCIYENSEA